MNKLTKEQQLEQQLISTKVSLAEITMSLQHSQKQVSALEQNAIEQEQMIKALEAENEALKESIAGNAKDAKSSKAPKQ